MNSTISVQIDEFRFKTKVLNKNTNAVLEAVTLVGIQMRTVKRSATAKLARKRFVGPFNCLDAATDAIISVLPKIHSFP